MGTLLRWLAGPLLVSGLTSCDSTACTLIGCDDRLQVETSAALPVRYTIELTLDGVSGSAACDVTNLTAGGASQGVLTGQLGRAVNCMNEGFTVSGVYEAATVRLLGEDGTLLGERSFEPEYDGDYPNGEDCGAACQVAQADVHIAPTP
jgi:hypothetical protein